MRDFAPAASVILFDEEGKLANDGTRAFITKSCRPSRLNRLL